MIESTIRSRMNALTFDALSLKSRCCFVLFMVLLLGAWGYFQWFNVRPTHIEFDHLEWRQTDTQSIALNFLHEEDRILWPRINWRGAGPGFVETEFQLYTYLASLLMRLGGEGVWAGQLISFFAMLLAMSICIWQIARRFSLWAVVAATIVLFSARNCQFLSTSVQPDASAFLFYVAAFWSFVAWIENSQPRLVWLVVAAVLTTLAALIKPPALHLGIVQFLLLLLLKPERLLRPSVWLAWLFILIIVGVFLWHAAQLHLQYGNTFGVISGGDSKFPKWHHLFESFAWLGLWNAIKGWGLGIVGTLAMLWLILRWQCNAIIMALLIGIGIFLVVAMRYTSESNGHYLVYLLPLAAYVVAKVVDLSLSDLDGLLPRFNLQLMRYPLVIVGFTVLVLFSWQRFQINNYERMHAWPSKLSIFVLAEKFQAHLLNAEPNTTLPLPWPVTQSRVVARSLFSAYDSVWETVDNFEDPRFFYAARVFGWVLPADPLTPERLKDLRRQGAEYYIEQKEVSEGQSDLHQWLQSNARLLIDIPEGKIWQLTVSG